VAYSSDWQNRRIVQGLIQAATGKLNLTALGLERRTKSAMTVDAVLDDIAQKRGDNA